LGEFKDRIIERAFRQSRGKPPMDVPLPDVFDLAEEMQKEFWREIDELCNIKNLHATDAINRMTDLILKWLGEPQK